VGRYDLSLPKSGGVRVKEWLPLYPLQGAYFVAGVFMLLMGMELWRLALWLLLLLLAALLVGFVILPYLGVWRRVRTVTLYPGEHAMVRRFGYEKTPYELCQPLHLYLKKLNDDELALLGGDNPVAEDVPGVVGLQSVRLMVSCKFGEELVAYGSEKNMLRLYDALRQQLRALEPPG